MYLISQVVCLAHYLKNLCPVVSDSDWFLNRHFLHQDQYLCLIPSQPLPFLNLPCHPYLLGLFVHHLMIYYLFSLYQRYLSVVRFPALHLRFVYLAYPLVLLDHYLTNRIVVHLNSDSFLCHPFLHRTLYLCRNQLLNRLTFVNLFDYLGLLEIFDQHRTMYYCLPRLYQMRLPSVAVPADLLVAMYYWSSGWNLAFEPLKNPFDPNLKGNPRSCQFEKIPSLILPAFAPVEKRMKSFLKRKNLSVHFHLIRSAMSLTDL